MTKSNLRKKWFILAYGSIILRRAGHGGRIGKLADHIFFLYTQEGEREGDRARKPFLVAYFFSAKLHFLKVT